jgi:hypothetical protein
MVNVVPLFGDERKIYRPFETYLDYYPLGRIGDLSVILMFDDELYPRYLSRLYKGQIVL